MSSLLALFVNPLFLLGVPTAAIPVILHLIHQRRAPVYHFSTLRFLRISHQKTARRKRLYDRFLLLLRALLFALLAIGLAQPFLRSGPALLGGRASTAAAVVFDRSYSMGCKAGESTRLGTAKQAAETLFDGFNSEDLVSVVTTPLATDEPETRTGPNEARQFARRLTVSSGRAEMGESLLRASQLLRESPRPNKELYVFSDMQRNSWNIPESLRGNIDPDTPILVVDCGSGQVENLAILDVEVQGKRRVLGVPVTIEARIRNFTGKTQKPKVAVYVDRQKTAEETVEVAAGAETVVLFSHSFETEGPHSGFVLLPDDALEADNRRFFQVDIQTRLPVLLVRDAEPAVESLDPTFYLSRALDPYSPLGLGERSIVRADVCQVADVSERKLTDYAAVFLANCREVPPPQAQALHKYVKGGGGLVIFLHESLKPDAWNEFLKGEGEPLVPVQLVSAQGVTGAEQPPLEIREPNLEHPVLQPFKGEARHLFRQIRVEEYIALESANAEGPQIVLRLSNGAPLLLESEAGSGKVFLWTVAATTDSSNLPVNNLFLPLLHQSLYHLSGSPDVEREFLVGHSARLAFQSQFPVQKLKVTTPSKTELESPVTKQGEDCLATVQETTQPGVYQASADVGDKRDIHFVVNVDAQESDMESISEEELAKRLPSERLTVLRRPEDVQAAVRRMREGIQLWNFFLAAVVLLALTECFVANKHTLTRGIPGTKPETPA
jgi:hypothetical protein